MKIADKIKKTYSRQRRLYSIRLSMVISYFMVLMIALTSSFILFNFTKQIVEDQMINLTESAVRQASDNMTQIVQNTSNLWQKMSVSDNITRIRLFDEPLNAVQRFDIYTAITKEMGYNNNWYGIDDFLLYYPKGDFVLNNWGKNTVLVTQQSYFSFASLDEETFRKIISEETPKGSVTTIPEGLFFVRSLPPNQSFYFNVVAYISSDTLRKSLLSTDWVKDGILLIYDKEDQLIYTNGEAENVKLEDQARALYDGKKTYYASCTSTNGWKSILIMSPDTYARLAAQTNRVFILYISGFAILGVIMVLLFSHFNYKPISKLVKKIGEKGTDDARNEYELIDSAVKNILDEEENAHNEVLEKERYYQRKNFFTRMIHKQLNMSLITKERMDDYGISISHSNGYLLVIFPILSSTQYYAHIAPVSSVSKTMEEQVDDYLFEMIQSHYDAYSFEINGMLTFLINLSSADRTMMDQSEVDHMAAAESETDLSPQVPPISGIIESAVEGLYENLGVQTAAYCSAVHTTNQAIPLAFDEARNTLYRQAHNGGGADPEKKIFYYETGKDFSKFEFTIEMEQNLLSNLLSGNVSEVQNILNELNQSLIEKANPVTSDLIINSLLVVLFQVYDKSSDVLDEGQKEKLILLATNRSSASEKFEELKANAVSIALAVDEKRAQVNHPLLNEILSYLHQNFSNPDLSNTMIADAVGISTAYLSRFYKSQTGDKISNALNRLRIDAAKEILLANPELDNALVGKDVGFESVSTFLRSFKKQEGITPGQYREMNSK